MLDRILHIIDNILIIGTCFYTLYLFILAVASHFRKRISYAKSERLNRILVLIPTDSQFPQSDYPCYETVTYTDRAAVIKEIDENKYDIAVLLGRTHQLSPQFLEKINDAFNAGVKAAQLHSILEKRSTFSSKLQAIREEVGNSLYQKGNIQIGCSGSLTGPDIAIDMKWLKKNQKSSKSNLEKKLFKQQIDIEYLEDVCVYREKYEPHWFIPKRIKVLSKLKTTLLYGSWSYINRCIQWLLPSPRSCLIVTSIWTLIVLFYDWGESFKWFNLLFVLLFTICLAIPDYLVEDKKRKKS